MLFGIFVRSVEDGLEPSQTYDEVNKILLLSNLFEMACRQQELNLSYDVASGSEITPCNKICKPLVVYRFT